MSCQVQGNSNATKMYNLHQEGKQHIKKPMKNPKNDRRLELGQDMRE